MFPFLFMAFLSLHEFSIKIFSFWHIFCYSYLINKKDEMSKLKELEKYLRRGSVYRRADLEQWSNAVDRHLGWMSRAK